jgi:hypothetical protein
MRLLIVAGMLVLTVPASVTPANARGASVSAPHCRRGAMVSVRAGMPCVFFPLRWGGFLHVTGIIEPPHNGTAVLRADGSIYYSPKPGFTGRDGMRVQVSCDVPVKLQEMAFFCRAPTTTGVGVFVE